MAGEIDGWRDGQTGWKKGVLEVVGYDLSRVDCDCPALFVCTMLLTADCQATHTLLSLFSALFPALSAGCSVLSAPQLAQQKAPSHIV